MVLLVGDGRCRGWLRRGRVTGLWSGRRRMIGVLNDRRLAESWPLTRWWGLPKGEWLVWRMHGDELRILVGRCESGMTLTIRVKLTPRSRRVGCMDVLLLVGNTLLSRWWKQPSLMRMARR